MFLLIMVFVFLANTFFIPKVFALQTYPGGSIRINEFVTNTAPGVNQWYELINTTGEDIDLTDWKLNSTVNGEFKIGTLIGVGSKIIPANNGIIVVTIPYTTSDDAGDVLTIKYPEATTSAVFAVSYGNQISPPGPHHTDAPGLSQSAALTNGGETWSIVATPTFGWNNEVPPQTIATMVSNMNSYGISTNLDTVTNPTVATDFYFEKRANISDASSVLGKLIFASPLNLTNASTSALLESFGTKMSASAGRIKLDAREAPDMKNAGGVVSMYKLNDIGYDVSGLSTSSMTVRDDMGNIISGTSLPVFSGISTSPLNGGTFTFTTSHFTQFEFNPVLSEVQSISSPTSSTSPYYIFSSNLVGTVQYGGACSRTSTSSVRGDNTIAFGPLPSGVYSDCTIKVIDGAGASSTLLVSSFTVSDVSGDTSAISADKSSLSESSIKGGNSDLSHITVGLTNPLPSVGSASSSSITWSSASTTLVSNSGQVTRPAFGGVDATTTITATITKGFQSDIKVFDLTVLAETIDPDIAKVAADKATLTENLIRGDNPDLSHVTVHLVNPLPSSGSSSSTITWVSASTTLISSNGQTINRPATTQGDATTTLTATITKGAQFDTKIFSIIVLKIPAVTVTTVSSGGGGGGGGGGIITPPFAVVSLNSTTTVKSPTVVSMPQATTTVPKISQDTGTVLGASISVFRADLKKGMMGGDVKELQKRLFAEGLFKEDITGYFGNLTLLAVRAFQSKNNLPSTGFVGSMTRAILNGGNTAPGASRAISVTNSSILNNPAYVFTRDLTIGMAGDDVKELQKRLTSEGLFAEDITGYLGVLTLKSIKDFQTKNNLPATGYVGPMTRGVLNGMKSVTSNI